MGKTTERKKMYLSTFLYIFIPILIGLVSKFIFHFQIQMVVSICYLISLLFLIPTDSLFGNVLDYNAKSINPTFRPEKNKFISGPKFELMRFVLVLIALILNILIWYYTSI